MRPAALAGVFAPLTTPFDPQTGDVAPLPLRQQARALIAAGLDGVVVAGSTGEAALLDDAELARAVEAGAKVRIEYDLVPDALRFAPLAGLPAALAKLSDALDGVTGNLPDISHSIGNLGTTIGAINPALNNGRAVIAEYTAQLTQTKAAVDSLSTSVPGYATTMALGALFQWLWTMVVQIIVLIIGLVLLCQSQDWRYG